MEHVKILVLLVAVSVPLSEGRRYVALPVPRPTSPYEINSLPYYKNSRSFDLSSNRYNIDNTIEQVQNILKSTPGVPRLTKGEIIDLLEQLAKEDFQKLKSNSRSRNPKAIMVVMPYSPSRNADNVEDFYTRKPVTKIIDSEDDKNSENVRLRRPIPVIRKRNKFKIATAEPETINFELTTSNKNMFVDLNPGPSNSSSLQNHLQYFNVKAVPQWNPKQTTQVNIETSTKPTTRKFFRRKYSPRTTTTPEYFDDKLSSTEIRQSALYLMKSPIFQPEENKIAQSTESETENPSKIPDSTFSLAKILTTTPRTLTDDLQIPDSLKDVFKSLNLDQTIPKQNIFSKERNQIRQNKKPLILSTTTSKVDVDANMVAENLDPGMKELLMSFGLLGNSEKVESREEPTFIPDKAEIDREAYIGFKPLPDDGYANDEMEKLLASFGLGRSSRKGRNVKHKNQNINFDVVPESMASVLKDMGLVNSLNGINKQHNTRADESDNFIKSVKDRNDIVNANNEVITEINVITHVEEHDEIQPNLDNSSQITATTTDDLKDFLTEKNRNNDSISKDPIIGENSIIEENMINYNWTEKHTFNPTEIKDIKQNEKLEKLMSAIKKHLNGNNTEDIDIKDLKELSETLNETHLNTFNKYLNSETSYTTLSNEEVTTDKPTIVYAVHEINNSTIEEKNNGTKIDDSLGSSSKDSENIAVPLDTTTTINFLDSLADSFPQSDQVTPVPESTTKKRSGFYYLIDWNTFLEVDDTKGKRVNLRFQPTIGDPQKFLSVSVP